MKDNVVSCSHIHYSLNRLANQPKVTSKDVPVSTYLTEGSIPMSFNTAAAMPRASARKKSFSVDNILSYLLFKTVDGKQS